MSQTKIAFTTFIIFTLWTISKPANALTISVNCSFERGVAFVDNVMRIDVDDLNLEFMWDRQSGEAFGIGNQGLSEVTIIPNNSGFSLVEITGTGNTMITTIARDMQAVHSRHSITPNGMIPQQFWGVCTFEDYSKQMQ